MNQTELGPSVPHARNCAAWLDPQGSDCSENCTCERTYRIALSSEQTLHAACRKRAKKSEAQLLAQIALTNELQARVDALTNVAHDLWYQGGKLIINLVDSLELHPENWDIESARQRIELWNGAANAYFAAALNPTPKGDVL